MLSFCSIIMLRSLNNFYGRINRMIQNGGNRAVCDPGAKFAVTSHLRAATFSLNPSVADVQEFPDSFTSVGGIKRRILTRSCERTNWENSFGMFADHRPVLHRLYHDAGQYRLETKATRMAAMVCERCRSRDRGSPGGSTRWMSFLPRSGRGRLGSLAVPVADGSLWRTRRRQICSERASD